MVTILLATATTAFVKLTIGFGVTIKIDTTTVLISGHFIESHFLRQQSHVLHVTSHIECYNKISAGSTTGLQTHVQMQTCMKLASFFAKGGVLKKVTGTQVEGLSNMKVPASALVCLRDPFSRVETARSSGPMSQNIL